MVKPLRVVFALLFLLPLGVGAQGDPIVIGSGNMQGVRITSSSDTVGASGEETLNGNGLRPNLTAAARFLAQATLGADLEAIEAASQKSFSEWLDEQFQMPGAFSVEQFTRELVVQSLDSSYANGSDLNRVYPRIRHWQTAWWQYTMTSPDLLRNRVALALSEIFVVSEVPQLQEYPLALANYYDMLLENAFGNFRDLLFDVTMHPAMGVYLTHVNNPRANPATNQFPDENYAREVMQLFTIGLYELNPDGSAKFDSLNNPIPSYDNTDIENLAKFFTGLSYGDAFLFFGAPLSELSFTVPMKMFDFYHEPGDKYLPDSTLVPAQVPVDGMHDINAAVDWLYNHPNVGPFIGRLLIQRLVKSNPSGEYIAGVAEAFNDNGQGVRGDMKAVVRAVLMHPEARDCYFVEDPFAGMLKEPLKRYVELARGFNAFSPSGQYRNRMDDFYEDTFQRVLASPSVFNFFQPDYQPIGPVAESNLVAPEFQITNSVSILGYANRLHDFIMKDDQIMESFLLDGEQSWEGKRAYLDLSDELLLGENGAIQQLIERLNLVLVQGQLSETTRQQIYLALSEIPADDWELMTRMALFLVMISPDYLILR